MGIKTSHLLQYFSSTSNSEKPPHHMGIKTGCPVEWQRILGSEKPPHHMGIKTFLSWGFTRLNCPLKNLPTTWGLRQGFQDIHGIPPL